MEEAQAPEPRKLLAAPGLKLRLAIASSVIIAAGAMTHSGALDGQSLTRVATTDGKTLDARVAAYEPSTGLVLLETGPSARPSATVAAASPEPGTLAAGVALWDGRDIAAPVFVTSVSGDRYGIGTIGDSVLPGMPIYTVDGELLAIAAGNDQEGVAFPVREAASRLIVRAKKAERLTSLGIGFQDTARRSPCPEHPGRSCR